MKLGEKEGGEGGEEVEGEEKGGEREGGRGEGVVALGKFLERVLRDIVSLEGDVVGLLIYVLIYLYILCIIYLFVDLSYYC